MGINCSLKSSTRTHGVILFLSATHTHTLNTGWYKYGSRLKARGRQNPGGLVLPDKGDVDPDGESAESQRFQGGRQRRWSSSPGVIPGRVSSGIPGGLRRNSREFPAV